MVFESQLRDERGARGREAESMGKVLNLTIKFDSVDIEPAGKLLDIRKAASAIAPRGLLRF